MSPETREKRQSYGFVCFRGGGCQYDPPVESERADAIEDRIRQIVREELAAALSSGQREGS